MEKSNENAILWGLIERIGIIIVLAGALTLIIPSLIGAQSNYTLLAGAGILVLGAIAHIVVTMLAIDKTVLLILLRKKKLQQNSLPQQQKKKLK